MRNQLKKAFRQILTPRGGLIVGVAIVLLGNAAILARVAYNRGGEPEIWVFSDREFARSLRYYYRRNRENTGMALQLDWRTPPPDDLEPSRYRTHARSLQVEPGRLDALGYPANLDCSDLADRRPERSRRRVWAALEFDGPAHRRYIALVEEHLDERVDEAGASPSEEARQQIVHIRDKLDQLQNHGSRLYAVDVALGRMELEQRYRNKVTRHLILPAVVSPRYHCKQPTRIYVQNIFNASIHVPKSHRAAFSRIAQRGSRDSEPNFEVRVAYGRLREPWLEDIEVVE